MIAAAVSPDTVFLFLLNSSGAIILFVYLLIAISQIVLRRRTPPDKLTVKMWLFPALSILAVLAIVAVLVQMALNADARTQLILSLLSWAVVLILYCRDQVARAGRSSPRHAQRRTRPEHAQRVLVLANETVDADELLDELRRIDRAGKAEYFVCVPANPVDTGQAMHKGPVYMWEATVEAAQERLDDTLAMLRSETPRRRGSSATTGRCARWPERWPASTRTELVICTLPVDRSAWLRYDVVDRARSAYDIPVTHVVSSAPVPAAAGS